MRAAVDCTLHGALVFVWMCARWEVLPPCSQYLRLWEGSWILKTCNSSKSQQNSHDCQNGDISTFLRSDLQKEDLSLVNRDSGNIRNKQEKKNLNLSSSPHPVVLHPLSSPLWPQCDPCAGMPCTIGDRKGSLPSCHGLIAYKMPTSTLSAKSAVFSVSPACLYNNIPAWSPRVVMALFPPTPGYACLIDN